jgi:hypothetical protein
VFERTLVEDLIYGGNGKRADGSAPIAIAAIQGVQTESYISTNAFLEEKVFI